MSLKEPMYNKDDIIHAVIIIKNPVQGMTHIEKNSFIIKNFSLTDTDGYIYSLNHNTEEINKFAGNVFEKDIDGYEVVYDDETSAWYFSKGELAMDKYYELAKKKK